MEMTGNKQLLSYHKIGFLASSHIDVAEVMGCFEWASKKMEKNTCVISGFSSKMERDVLHFLLLARTPVIIVLARQLYKNIPEEWQPAFHDNQMLILSLSNASRQSRELAFKRNEYIAESADELLFTGVTETSSLYPLVKMFNSKVIRLDDFNK